MWRTRMSTIFELYQASAGLPVPQLLNIMAGILLSLCLWTVNDVHSVSGSLAVVRNPQCPVWRILQVPPQIAMFLETG